MADLMAAAKAALAESQKAVERSHAEYKERMKGHPMPSQADADLMRLGAPLLPEQQQESAAAPEPPVRTRQMESGAKGDYATRASRASTASSSSTESSS